MKTVEIIIKPDGRTTVQTMGFIGPSCREASNFIELALGQQITESLTTEFHQVQTTELHQQQRS
jgi:hypothetical protein